MGLLQLGKSLMRPQLVLVFGVKLDWSLHVLLPFLLNKVGVIISDVFS